MSSPTPSKRRPTQEVGLGTRALEALWPHAVQARAGGGHSGPGVGGRGRLAPLGRATPANRPGVGDAPALLLQNLLG